MDPDRRPWPWWGRGLALAAVFEAATLVARFGLGWKSRAVVQPLTFGLRIHHGYLGAALFLALPLLPKRWRSWAAAIAVGLVLSDLAHHFLVLWPITGHPDG
ncbi:MAG: hypothetical protein L0216_13345 [Planctomycetales bacterium]|nr:hypothetical protein [Planctomycetales bacterium]